MEAVAAETDFLVPTSASAIQNTSLEQKHHMASTSQYSHIVEDLGLSPFHSGSQSSTNITTITADPFKGLCQIKEEFIFVFSGFNEKKLLCCETLDTQRGIWKEIATITNARTKFAAVPISKSRILIFGGK